MTRACCAVVCVNRGTGGRLMVAELRLLLVIAGSVQILLKRLFPGSADKNPIMGEG